MVGAPKLDLFDRVENMSPGDPLPVEAYWEIIGNERPTSKDRIAEIKSEMEAFVTSFDFAETDEFLEKHYMTFIEMSPLQIRTLFIVLREKGILEGFLRAIVDDYEMVALFSYWQKWMPVNIRKRFDYAVENWRQEPLHQGEYPLGLDQRMSDSELELMAGNLYALQLTFGCSFGCYTCGVDAVPGVRGQMSYSKLRKFIRRHLSDLRDARPLLHFASDPENYLSENKRFADVRELLYPHGHLDQSAVVSRSRSADFWKSLPKGSMGHLSVDQIPDIEEIRALRQKLTQWGIHVHEGMQQDIDDLLEVEGSHDLPAHYQALARANKISHQRGIGVSTLREGYNQVGGVCHVTGMVLTPRGVYNVVSLDECTEKYPQGLVVVPTSGTSFRYAQAGQSIESVLTGSFVLNSMQAGSFVSVRIETDWGPQAVAFDVRTGEIIASRRSAKKRPQI